MIEPLPYVCRWVKQRGQLMLQQYMPAPAGYVGEWVNVPVVASNDLETTQHMPRTGSSKSGPQDAITSKTSTALEPIFETPDQIERQIEQTMLVLTSLMKMRAEMSGFPPYDGTLVLVHGADMQRMFVNGFPRTMPAQSLLLVIDADLHRLQTHSVPPPPKAP